MGFHKVLVKPYAVLKIKTSLGTQQTEVMLAQM